MARSKPRLAATTGTTFWKTSEHIATGTTSCFLGFVVVVVRVCVNGMMDRPTHVSSTRHHHPTHTYLQPAKVHVGKEGRVDRAHPREEQRGEGGHHARDDGVVGRLERALVAEREEGAHAEGEGQGAEGGAKVEARHARDEVREAVQQRAALVLFVVGLLVGWRVSWLFWGGGGRPCLFPYISFPCLLVCLS